MFKEIDENCVNLQGIGDTDARELNIQCTEISFQVFIVMEHQQLSTNPLEERAPVIIFLLYY